MKTPSLILLFGAMLALTGNAQSDSISRNSKAATWQREASLTVYAGTIRGGNFYSQYRSRYDQYAFSGISMKFFRGPHAIRSSVDYFQRMGIGKAYFPDDRTISFKTFQLAAGYQYHFGKGRVMPYLFADLSYGFGKELVHVPYYRELAYPTHLPYVYEHDLQTVTTHAFSLTPGAGLRFRLGKQLVLNVESAAEFFVMRQLDLYLPASNVVGINAKVLKCTFGFTF